MVRLWFLFTVLTLSLVAPRAIGGDDDAVAAVFVFGRAGGWTASAFAVGDGSYILASLEAVTEPAPGGRKRPVARAVVVSRWTGEAYAAKVLARDDQAKVALLKLPTQAVPPVGFAEDEVLDRAPIATLGQLLSGEEVGGRFPTVIYALDVERKVAKFTVRTWRAANACMVEVRERKLLFLSKVHPPERAPKAALVTRAGKGAVGLFQGRLVVEGGPKPVVFYQTLPARALRAFLTGAGVPAEMLSDPRAVGSRPDDADAAFQTMCRMLSASFAGSPSVADSAAAAIKLRPKNAIAHFMLGTALARAGKPDEALKEIDSAAELEPALPDVNLNRGLVLAAAGKHELAEASVRKAMGEDLKDIRPMIALAGLLADRDGGLDEAVRLARTAVQTEPTDSGARLVLARMLKRKKDYDGATQELRALLDASPNWSEARIALAATYEAAGKLDLAEAEYRKVVEAEPANPEPHLVLIEFLIAAEKKDEARQAIETVRKLKLDPVAEEAVKKLEAKLAKADD